MHPQRRAMAAINVLGGIAVLGSYAHGIATNPETRGDVWGGVPEGLQPLYTVSMLAATAGYFLFTSYFFFRADPDVVRIAGRHRFGTLNALYALVLVPSVLWMPLTFAMLEAPSAGLWWAIRVVLFAVGAGSLGLLAALLAIRPRGSALAWGLAVLGLAAFCFQTAVLDAVVWPAYFPA